MPALERILQLQKEGLADWQIINILKEEGFSPKEINEALSQSKIKKMLETESKIKEPVVEYSSEEEMQPTIAADYQEDYERIPSYYRASTAPYEEEYEGERKEIRKQSPNLTTAIPQTSEDTYSYQEEYNPETLADQYQQGSYDLETINEVVDQIVEEKTSKLKKQFSSFKRFREEIVDEIERINLRIQKIEETLTNLEIAIIGKIGEYQRNIENVTKEMHATQESFSKILNPLIDNVRELQKITKFKNSLKKSQKVSNESLKKEEILESQDSNSDNISDDKINDYLKR